MASAAFLPPLSLPLCGKHRPALSTTTAPIPRITRRSRPPAAAIPEPARIPRASVAPSAPARSTNPLAPPQLVPYPRPAGLAGERAEFVATCPSVPAVFRAMAADPAFASLRALTDEHHSGDRQLTFAQLGDRVTRMAAGLADLGLREGQVVSFFSENSHRWLVADLAIMTVGAAAAVRGVAAPVSELCYIYEHSRSVALIVEDVGVLDRVVAAGLDRSNVGFVVVLFGSVDAYRDAELPVYSYDDVLQRAAEQVGDTPGPEVGRADVATVLYTSGTTGSPKGVVLTHDNLLSQLADISLGSLDPLPSEVFVSILPCWHVFERTAAYWTLSKGVELVYSNKRRFKDDLLKHKPHMLIAVPRVFENLHAAILNKMENASSLRRTIFGFFMAVSLAFVHARRRLKKLEVSAEEKGGVVGKVRDVLQFALLMPLFALANKLVWSKIRQGTGGRLRMCLSGGGSIAGYLEDFFECAGIDICVGYGLTETSPVIANRFGQHNVRGSTGMALPRAYVKIVDRESGKLVEPGEQGTLFTKGPYVFSEYLKDPEATVKAFDSDGYFDTGDLAFNTPSGDIVIAGRSKDLIVLSNGENIEPGPIEDTLLSSPLIDQVMLVGQDEKALGALVVPKLDYLEREGVIDPAFRSKVEKLQNTSPEDHRAELRELERELESNVEFNAALSADIRDKNRARAGYSANDRISFHRILLTPFTVENGMMTQTLKIRKNVVSRIYAAEIAALYKK